VPWTKYETPFLSDIEKWGFCISRRKQGTGAGLNNQQIAQSAFSGTAPPSAHTTSKHRATAPSVDDNKMVMVMIFTNGSVVLTVNPCFAELASYLMRGNPIRLSGFRLEFIPHGMRGRDDDKRSKPRGAQNFPEICRFYAIIIPVHDDHKAQHFER